MTNSYHKIIGSNIFGFEDFSILNIEGLFSPLLKGSYEHFSQFLNDIPDELYSENFIVWEGYIYSLSEILKWPDGSETTRENPTKEILFFEGRFRKINDNEVVTLTRKSQKELFQND